MKIWLSKNSDIPVRRQLETQITLGIASGDLPADARVPSTRELAARFGIHANTVGAAYKNLLEKGLIKFRKGSGFYVRPVKNENGNDELRLDSLVSEFFKHAQSLGFSSREIEEHLHKRFAAPPAQMIAVVERDENLLAILIEEIRTATNLKVVGVSPEAFQNQTFTTNTVFAALSGEMSVLENLPPDDAPRVSLIARSVSASMKGEPKPDANDLIAVASGWNKFLILARTVLVAANVDADAIILRSTADADWRAGLKNASMIICDVLTAQEFGGDERIRPFRVVSDHSLDALIKAAS